ncbi:hypothetical protein Tco_0705157, partial [Tanacetum coccineum]
DYIPGPEDPQTPPVPQDEDEREPMFVQAHDPDYVPEPIYPEYIPLEDEHKFSTEEQPILPVDSPTAESPGYVTESDLEEDPEEYEDDETKDGPVDYPMDGGDDGDDDDEDDEDEDDEDEEEEEEKEEHLAPADSAIVVLVNEPGSAPPSAGERLARCTAPPAHSSPLHMPSPLLPSSGCPTQIQTPKIVSTQALIDAVTDVLPSPPLPPLPPSLYIPPPVDRRDDIPESEPTRGRGIDYGFVSTVDAEERQQGIRDIRVTELVELHEHDTQDLYALLVDAQDRFSQVTHQELHTHRDHVYSHETHLQAHQTQLQLQGTDGRDSPSHYGHEARDERHVGQVVSTVRAAEES